MCPTNDPIRRPRFTPLPNGFGELLNKAVAVSSAIAEYSASRDAATVHSSMASSQLPRRPRYETGGDHPTHPWPLPSRTSIASSGSVSPPHSDKGRSSPNDSSEAAPFPELTAKKHECRHAQKLFVTHNYHDHAADTPESLMPPDEPASTQMVTPSLRPKLSPLTSSPVVLPLLEEATCGQNAAFGDEVPALPLPALQVPKEWQEQGRHNGGVKTPFPQKLHEMLTQSDEAGHSEVVSWQPHGRAFRIHQPRKFVSEVLPKYFRQSKFSSFQRQVNLYGFSRLTTGPDEGSYYHELFLRGNPFLCRKIRRIQIKGTGIRAASSPETEPDFYNMASIDKEGHMHPPLLPVAAAASSLSSSHSRSAPIVAMSRGGAEMNRTEPLPFQDDSDHCFDSSDSNSLGERLDRPYNNEDKISLKRHSFRYLRHGKLKPFEKPSVSGDIASAASIPFLMTGQCSSASAARTARAPCSSAPSFSSPSDTCAGRADTLMMFPTMVGDINNAGRDDELLEEALKDFLSEVDISPETHSDSREASCGNNDTKSNGTMSDTVVAGIQCDESFGLLLDKIFE